MYPSHNKEFITTVCRILRFKNFKSFTIKHYVLKWIVVTHHLRILYRASTYRGQWNIVQFLSQTGRVNNLAHMRLSKAIAIQYSQFQHKLKKTPKNFKQIRFFIVLLPSQYNWLSIMLTIMSTLDVEIWIKIFKECLFSPKVSDLHYLDMNLEKVSLTTIVPSPGQEST